MIRIDPNEKLYHAFITMYGRDPISMRNYYTKTINLGIHLLTSLRETNFVNEINNSVTKLTKMCRNSFSNLHEIEDWLFNTTYSNEYFIGEKGEQVTEYFLRGEFQNLIVKLNNKISTILDRIRFQSGTQLSV